MIALTHGRTTPIPYQLTRAGAPLDITGFSVTLVGKDGTGTDLSLTGTVTVNDAVTGQVQFEPGANDIDLAKEPYRVHFEVTDGAGKKEYFPNGPGEIWRIYPQ